MRDLLTPGYFLPNKLAGRRQSQGHLGAYIRLSALLRQELLVTDRMIMQSDAIFALMREDQEFMSLLKSDICQIASFEHEMGTERNLNLSETAMLLRKYKVASDPARFEVKALSEQFCNLINDLDANKKYVNSPINTRDEIFTEIVEGVVNKSETDTLKEIFKQEFHPQLSDLDYLTIRDELNDIFSELKAVSSSQNVDNAAILGIVDFLPDYHPHALGRTDNFFVLAKQSNQRRLLSTLLADRRQIQVIQEWINASYISAEAATFSQNAILCGEVSPFEAIVARERLIQGDDVKPDDTDPLKVDSWLFTVSNINSLTYTDIRQLRESQAGVTFFDVFSGGSTNRVYKDVLYEYLLEVIERIKKNTSSIPADSFGKLSVELIRKAGQLLLRLNAGIEAHPYVNNIAGLFLRRIPLQLIVTLTHKTLTRTENAILERTGQDRVRGIIGRPSISRNTYLRF